MKMLKTYSGKYVPHEITLIAFTPANDQGAVCVCDIIETSYKLASYFTRRWYRDPDVTEIAAVPPGGWVSRGEVQRRKIAR